MKNVSEGFQLSPLQRRLWLLSRQSGFYRAYCSIEITGMLQVERFYQALYSVCARHETFRTHFHHMPGMTLPLQVVDEQPAWTSHVYDLRRVGPDERQQVVEKLMHSALEQPLAGEEGPLLHCSLLILTERRYLCWLFMPSLLADRRTLQNFSQELARAYEMEKTSAVLNEEVFQYLQFSTWQHSLQKRDDDLEKEAVRWQLEVAEVAKLKAVNPPFMKKAGVADPFKPAQYSIALEGELWFQVQRWLAGHPYSLSVLFSSCWAALLARLCGYQQLMLAVQVDGREYTELLRIAGQLEKTLPLLCQIDVSLPFMDLLTQVQQQYERLLSEYPTFSSETLLGIAQREASASLSPFSFAFAELPSPCQIGAITMSLQECVCYSEPFALRLVVLQQTAGIRISWQYHTGLLSASTVEQIAENFLTLLQGVLSRPQVPLGHLPLLSLSQREQQVLRARGEALVLPDCGVHRLFEAQVRLDPERLAVRSASLSLSYGQLNARANRLARLLSQAGVGPNVLVGLCLERSAQALVGLLAVLKAGGAYMPLDGEQPVERLALLVQESQVPLLLTQQSLRARLPISQTRLLCLEELEEELAQQSSEDLPGRSSANDLAYVLYTSGSTGRPKGVVVQQQSLLNYSLAIAHYLPQERGLHFAMVSTLAADLGNTMIYGALVSGGCVDVLDYQTVTSAQAFTRWMQRYPVDVLKIVPSHLSALLAHAGEILPRHLLILGGETLPPRLLAQLRELGAECRVMNHYGPTEATIGVLVHELGRAWQLSQELLSQERVALGRPLANCEVYVLDEWMQIVPQGVSGEICLAGVGLAQGYMRDAEQTARRFVPHPFGERGGERLYRTGDVGYYNAEGQVEFVGRRDRQVKLRGYRVELAEIESVLRQHSSVSECMVLLHETAAEEQELIGYVVVRDRQKSPSKKELREFLQASLPDYMVPTHFVFLPSMPLTLNGKVDMHQLIEIGKEREDGKIDEMQEPTGAIVPPREGIELQLLLIWEEILQNQNISVVDNFFDLGGHSMLVLRLLALIHKQFGQDITPATFFLKPTIADLAVVLRQQNLPEKQSALVAFQTRGARPPFFCVHPSGGMVTSYMHLSRHLGQDQPFYGLQSTDLFSREETQTTIEDLALDYIKAIRTVQPQGPYLLGGWSMGGIIAYEMAQQLLQQGDQIALLGLIDSQLSNAEERARAITEDETLSDEMFARMMAINFKLELPPDFEQLDRSEVIKHIFTQAKQMHHLPTDADLEQVRRLFHLTRKHSRMARLYEPQIYRQRIDYFVARDFMSLEPDGEKGKDQRAITLQRDVLNPWRELVQGGLDIHVIPGTHRLMVEEPNVQTLAQSLQASISKVLSEREA